MKPVETTTILALSAIGERDHESAREELNKLSVTELREVIASSMMLNYLANETIDDKPRDLADEVQRSRFRLDTEGSPQ